MDFSESVAFPRFIGVMVRSLGEDLDVLGAFAPRCIGLARLGQSRGTPKLVSGL